MVVFEGAIVRQRRSTVEVRLRPGRHRLGRPGLQHCRQMRSVRHRMVVGPRNRHVKPVRRLRATAEVAAVMLMAAVASTVLISGWYAAAGAAVVAGIVTH
jgi:mRNA-degrading endonuclease toxin of MazEF toxin-antitoxin module